MSICFLGDSHAAKHLREAAWQKGLVITHAPTLATLVFVSQDTPTDEKWNRDLDPIRALLNEALVTQAQIVLTSQVPPGFTRSLGVPGIFHQPETLRILDAEVRALWPDYIVVGGEAEIGETYATYLKAFDCPVLRMSWEEAEFSKIAVNMTLAAQVDSTNKLSAAAEKYGAKWENVAKALRCDKRIGLHSYLTPGRWQDSTHLMRDYVTLEGILAR